MSNEEKTMLILEEVCNDEIPDENWTPCNLTCKQVRKKIEYACISIAQWKDRELLRALQDKVKELSDDLLAEDYIMCP